MLDRRARALYGPAIGRVAEHAVGVGISAGAVTAFGLLVGIGGCVAAALGEWGIALTLWLANRFLDGLDGAIARRTRVSDLGGMLDFLADFVIYAGFVVAVAIAIPDARLACTALLAAYLLNNVALLSFASLVEKRDLQFGDERSLRFTTGLTEGTETILAYTAICLLPDHASTIAWTFAAMVMVTVAQRVGLAFRTLT
ncbi:MAG: CDP-alcohol phosphatidyltransferase family protein [Solirubrobacterales bacterium]